MEKTKLTIVQIKTIIASIFLIFISLSTVKAQIYEHVFPVPNRPNNPLKFRIYVPEDVDTIKGVCFFNIGLTINGIQDWDKDRYIMHRSYYARQGYAFMMGDLEALVYGSYRYEIVSSWLGDAIFESLSALADSSAHPELKYSPLFLWGYSNGAIFANHFIMHKAERILGFFTCKGGAWEHFDDAQKTKAFNVPGIVIPGENDPTIPASSVMNFFNEGRVNKALWAQAFQPKGKHDRIYDTTFVFPFFRDLVKLRLPDSVSFHSLPKLKDIDAMDGWLGDNKTYKIAPYQCFNRDTMLTSWLPGKESALAWQKFVSSGNSVNNIISCDDSSVNTPYFGQEEPSITAEIFAPGIVSVHGRQELKYEERFDQKEALLTSKIFAYIPYHQQFKLSFEGDKWNFAEYIDILEKDKHFLAGYAPDGNSIFGSNSIDNNNKIWQSKRVNDSFASPKGVKVNYSDISSISFTNDNEAYFVFALPIKGLYKAKFENDSLTNPVRINVDYGSDPYVSKDGKYLVTSVNGDIYMSFNSGDDNWSDLINLKDKVNTSQNEMYPTISGDGKHMFFSRDVSHYPESDIFWVSTKILDYAKENKKPELDTPLADVEVFVDSVTYLYLPDNYFVDSNPFDSILNYTFKKSSGPNLPIWAKYNKSENCFKIKRNRADSVEVVITAKDIFGESAIDTFIIKVIEVPTSIKHLEKSDRFKIYPNPASSAIRIAMPTETFCEVSVEIISLTGKVIRQDYFTGSSDIFIDCSNFNKGVYVLRIKTNYGIEIHKLLLE